jgi:hypothetical protein
VGLHERGCEEAGGSGAFAVSDAAGVVPAMEVNHVSILHRQHRTAGQ